MKPCPADLAWPLYEGIGVERKVHSLQQGSKTVSGKSSKRHHHFEGSVGGMCFFIIQHGCQLSKDDWKAAVRKYGLEWKRLSKDDRKPFHVEASYQQSCRDELRNRPLLKPSEREAHPDVDGTLWAEAQPTNALGELAGSRVGNLCFIFLVGIILSID